MPTPLSTRSLTLRRAVFATGIQTDQRLIHLKAVLEQNGISDISTLGRLQLGAGMNIAVTRMAKTRDWELVLLLQRLLRHVTVAAYRETVRKDEQIQICCGVNAVVESLILIRELVDRRAAQS